MSSDGHAKLCDFGVSRMVSASSSMANLSTGPTGTIRYLAYEFLSGSSEEMMYTTKSDVWAFGMTVYVRPAPLAIADEGLTFCTNRNS